MTMPKRTLERATRAGAICQTRRIDAGARCLALAPLLVMLLGCGGRSGDHDAASGGRDDAELARYPWEPGAASGSTRVPRSCAEDWTVIYETGSAMPGALAVHESELIFGVDATTSRFGEVRAVDIAGSGRERRLRSGTSYEALKAMTSCYGAAIGCSACHCRVAATSCCST